jgi:hypothetical protein
MTRTTDYTMMTAEELRRAVAERLGYTVRENYDPKDWGSNYRYWLIAPDGKEITKGAGWSKANKDAIWTDEDYPDWPNDANAALALLDATGHRFLLSGTPSRGEGQDDDRYRCEIDDPDNRQVRYGPTPALAIVRAWLTRKDQQE